MQEDIAVRLEKCGVDWAAVNERFMGNVEMYEHFLKKFLEDSNYYELVDFVKEKNVKKAFECAHQLKGVSGNLSLECLYGVTAELTEYLREGRLESAYALLPTLQREYLLVYDILQKM